MKEDKSYKNSGFTLIEVVTTLILVGILAAVGGMGFYQITKGYLFTRESVALGYKSQVAMDRIQKSLRNLTAIDDGSNGTSLKITTELLDSGREETFALDGSSVKITSDLFGSSTAYTLVDNVRNFSISYWEEGDSSGSSKLPDQISRLSRIEVELELETSLGQSLVYSAGVTPRTYVPSNLVISTGALNGRDQKVTVGCFIATAVYGSYDAWPVLMLRQFRDKVLLKTDAGTSFTNWYYRHGPGWARGIEKHPGLKWVVKMGLSPVAGFVSILLFFPQGLVVLFAIAFLTGRLAFRFMPRGKKPALIKGVGGSMLLSLIVVMVIMAILAAGMTKMFSSSQMTKVPSAFSQKAYYLAYSGLEVALGQFDEDEDDFIDEMTSLDGEKTYTMDDEYFDIEFQGYWFRPDSNGFPITALQACGKVPESIEETKNVSGMFLIQHGTKSQEAYFTKGKIVPSGDTVVLNADCKPDTAYKFTPENDDNVYPAALVEKDDTITTGALGTANSYELDLTGWSKPAHAAMFLPPRNGVITLEGTDSGGSTEALVLLYDRLDTSGGSLTLVGLYAPDHISGVPVPGVYSVDKDTTVTFGKYAKMTSTGVVGSGDKEISQKLVCYKPLETAELFLTSGGMLKFDAGDDTNMTDVFGGYEVQDGAIKVTDTDKNVSYTTHSGKTDTKVYLQESMTTVNFENYDSDDPDFLKEMWESCDRKLSYQVQAKIKFTEEEDDTRTTVTPVNLPGHYMPGITFRVKQPKGLNAAATAGRTTYYGVSLMRGIYGVTTEGSSGGTCSTPTTTVIQSEDDDIPDPFMESHGSNNSANKVYSKCKGSEGEVMGTGNWSDDAMYDDIPYLVIWQKDNSTDENGDPMPADTCGNVDTELKAWHPLASMPLVEYKPVELYYYSPLTSEYRSGDIPDDLCLEYACRGGDKHRNLNWTNKTCQICYSYWWSWCWGKWYTRSMTCIKRYDLSQNPLYSDPDLQAGWYEGIIPGDARNSTVFIDGVATTLRRGPISAWKIRDPRGLFETTKQDGIEMLGSPLSEPATGYDDAPPVVLDPNTAVSGYAGTPMNYFETGITEPVAYCVYLTEQSDEAAAIKTVVNYRLYPKPWVTLVVNLMELQDDFDCNDETQMNGVDSHGNEVTGEERVNYISAYIGSPDDLVSATDSSMDRSALPVWGSSTIYSEVNWPQSLAQNQKYFWSGVWQGPGDGDTKVYNNGSKNGYMGYNSETVDPLAGTCAGLYDEQTYKLVERGEDEEDRYTGLYSYAYTTSEYWDGSFTHSEFGIHTLGINASGEYADGTKSGFRETCYFDDLAWRFISNITLSGLPGLIGQ